MAQTKIHWISVFAGYWIKLWGGGAEQKTNVLQKAKDAQLQNALLSSLLIKEIVQKGKSCSVICLKNIQWCKVPTWPL